MTHTRIHKQHTNTHAHTYAYTNNTQTRTHAHARAHRNTHTRTRALTHTHLLTHIHTHTHTHTHTRTRRSRTHAHTYTISAPPVKKIVPRALWDTRDPSCQNIKKTIRKSVVGYPWSQLQKYTFTFNEKGTTRKASFCTTRRRSHSKHFKNGA